LRAFGSYTLGRRTTDLIAPAVIVVERLRDGPVPALLDPGTGTDRAWSLGARVDRSFSTGTTGATAGARHTLLAGVDVSGGAASVQSAFAGRVGELVNGLPARVWDFTDPGDASRRRETSIAAFAGDAVAVAPRVTVNGGLPFETVNGSAASGSSDVSWRSLLPRAGIGRREKDLIGVVDVGVPESTYSAIGVPDAGIDLLGSADDQILLFYNRSPATFGADRYLLTNPAADAGSFAGADMLGQVRAQHFFFIVGGTAGRSEGLSANRGFGPLENDASVLGEVFIDPNARGHAQGRVFTERGYTIKTAASYRFPHDTTLGVIARYQDGQHFARLVIMQGLNQGAEAVRAFRN